MSDDHAIGRHERAERMKRLNADPEFAAKRVAASRIPEATRTAVIGKLKTTSNIRKVAKEIGNVSFVTVWRIARSADPPLSWARADGAD